MKKLIVLSAIAALTSGAAIANNDIGVSGTLPVTCSATTTGGNNANFTNAQMLAGSGTKTIHFDLICNDYHGADIQLKSTNGWLKNTDDTSGLTGVQYDAHLTADSGYYDFTLNAVGNTGPQVNNQAKPGTPSLASGTTGQIDISLQSAATWAGTHSDTLLMTVSAQ
ncbi:hypothetical protein [Pseudoalteromonas sp.]|uniref:hypothetical protein n=1 Tax=Pseudoalteromonas sp. TaxID=53249 RepID=UPI0035641656